MMEKEIEGSRNQELNGFMGPLLPEEIKRGLETKRLGKKIHYFAEIDSTNSYGCQRAQEGGMEGEVFIAECQTQGRGRVGRSWVSPPYLNLHLSVILHPTLPPIHAPQVTLMSAVALAETVQSFIPFSPEIKWPNDILANRKKLAGILTESACDGGKILFAVLGIGVNLNFPFELMPEAIRERATSVMILNQKPVDRNVFTRRLIQNLDQCYGDLEERGFSYISQRWEGFFQLKGKGVKVESIGQFILGKAVGIDRDGALLVQEDGGALQRIIAGDVIPMEP
jgi:BirA family biotin operon repressor/biotin-[acetyl-CoA-carboxylase] ligase